MVRDLTKSQEQEISDSGFQTIFLDMNAINITFDNFLLTQAGKVLFSHS